MTPRTITIAAKMLIKSVVSSVTLKGRGRLPPSAASCVEAP